MPKRRREDQEGVRWCRFVGVPQQMDGPLDIRQNARQMLDPRSKITVIVTEQDPHRLPRTLTNAIRPGDLPAFS